MKWKTLKHNGILFPPAFESQGIKIKIKGEKIDLDLLQEEKEFRYVLEFSISFFIIIIFLQIVDFDKNRT